MSSVHAGRLPTHFLHGNEANPTEAHNRSYKTNRNELGERRLLRHLGAVAMHLRIRLRAYAAVAQIPPRHCGVEYEEKFEDFGNLRNTRAKKVKARHGRYGRHVAWAEWWFRRLTCLKRSSQQLAQPESGAAWSPWPRHPHSH